MEPDGERVFRDVALWYVGLRGGIGHRASGTRTAVERPSRLGLQRLRTGGDGASAGYKVKIFLAYWNGPSGTTFGVAWDSW